MVFANASHGLNVFPVIVEEIALDDDNNIEKMAIHDSPQLSEDSFLLVIMTDFQAEMCADHSHRIVCIDSTHKTNPYGFKLDVTIVVPDEFKNGKKASETPPVCNFVFL